MAHIIDDSIFTNRTKVFLVGAMGGGKTEIAINYSMHWSEHLDSRVGLMDLDMVKPYFRLRHVIKNVERGDVELVVPDERYGYADFPMISAKMEAYVVDMKRRLVIDVGGDAVGARLVGRYRKRLPPEHVEFWYVYNGRRPFSRGEEDPVEIMEAVENVSGLKLTGIIHNTHLMDETSVETLLKNVERATELSQKTGVPLCFHCIREDLFEEASKLSPKLLLFPLKLHVKPGWA